MFIFIIGYIFPVQDVEVDAISGEPVASNPPVKQKSNTVFVIL